MISRESIVTVFEYITSKVRGDVDFSLRRSDRIDTMIDKFLSSLTPSYGEEWLFDFMCFQFSRYLDKKTRFNGKIMINWVIGKAALKVWREASDKHLYWGEELKQRFHLVNPISRSIELKTQEFRERERTRFLDLDERFLRCSELQLYDKGSETCLFCNNKKYCKICQKQ